ncbi:MAG: hypothetical protein EP330_13785 [Deltaproteobacteria bacterium]|nr:MAG: hypothetical protein EP330_13785 [Deltaproteobacteria bacterium]
MPKRVTGADGEVQHAPAPIAIDTPTWADVELMLDALTPDGCARWIERERERIAQETGCSAEEVDMRGFGYRPQWELHRQIALVQRWTGLRISQILSLTWEDLDLERRRLRIRQGTKGAKGQARDRIVPMHPSLAEELAGWGVREGHLFARMATKGAQRGQMLPLRGDGVAEVFTAAWKRAGVAPAKWDAVGREKARPTNAIRARWKSSIAGVAGYDLAKLMLGQSGGGEHDSYVAMGTPEASPYWSRMVSALTVLAAPSGDLGTSSHEVPDPPSSGH